MYWSLVVGVAYSIVNIVATPITILLFNIIYHLIDRRQHNNSHLCSPYRIAWTQYKAVNGGYEMKKKQRADCLLLAFSSSDLQFHNYHRQEILARNKRDLIRDREKYRKCSIFIQRIVTRHIRQQQQREIVTDI